MHERVPWLAFERIVTKNEATAHETRDLLETAGVELPVTVGRPWYP